MHVLLREKKKNQIKNLTVDNNQVVYSHVDIDRAFVNYFQNIFTSYFPSQQDIDECLVNIKPKVSNEMNCELTKPCTSIKIQEALNQMSPLKSFGLDDFNVDFFQSY